MAKSYEELKFTDNFMFVKILSTHLDLCAELIGLILRKKVSRLEPAIYERTVQPAYESRGIRFDVYVEDEELSRYDVEMQVDPEVSIAKRSRYYHSAMDMEMLLKGMDYTKLTDSYVIFICKNDIPGGFDRPISTFKNMCMEDPGKCLGDGTSTVFVNADCDSSGLPDDLREFLEFVKTGNADISSDSLAGRLQNVVAEAIRSGRWSAEYMRYEDEIKHIEFMAHEKGLKEGLERGLNEGLEKGLAKAEAERQRADSEQQRADSEQQRADSLAEEVERLKAELAALKK